MAPHKEGPADIYIYIIPNWEAFSVSVSAYADQIEPDRICYERVMADPKLRAQFYRMQSKQYL